MIKVGVVGATGYTGLELLRLLIMHPLVKLQVVTSRKVNGIPVADIYPSLRGKIDITFSILEEVALFKCDIVFFATPPGVAMMYTPKLLENGVKVIDLAADFRLSNPVIFEQWYKIRHHCPELLQEAAYGLVELNRKAIKQARVVGNPGCYPTTIQLGFAPLLRAGIIDTTHLIADCKSGVSGSGQKIEIPFLFSEAAENLKAYNVSGHRHRVETLEQLSKLTNDEVKLLFTPHLVPMIRGMYSTLYARLIKTIDNVNLQNLFEEAYHHESFIDVMPFGSHPETRTTRASNMLRIALHRPNEDDTVIILVIQDNLVKGASGQAIQCMNLMFSLNETTGLMHIPILP